MRYKEFHIGSITHQHMLAMANAETMERFHGSWGNYRAKHGDFAGATKAWDAAGKTADVVTRLHDTSKPVGKTRVVPNRHGMQLPRDESQN